MCLHCASPIRSRAVTPPFLVTLAALLALTALTGCADRAAVRTRATAPRLHQTDPLAVVHQAPLYQEAQQDCRAQHYAQAADRLRSLAAAPGLTPDQVAFCREQRNVCLRDAGRPTEALQPPVAFPSAHPAHASFPLTPDRADCGPRALALVCERLRRPCSLVALRHAAGTTAQGTTLAGLAKAAESVGLTAEGVQVDLPALSRLSGPAVAWVDGNHYVAVLSVDGDQAIIHDPNHTREEETATSALLARSGGILLALRQ